MRPQYRKGLAQLCAGVVHGAVKVAPGKLTEAYAGKGLVLYGDQLTGQVLGYRAAFVNSRTSEESYSAWFLLSAFPVDNEDALKAQYDITTILVSDVPGLLKILGRLADLIYQPTE